MHNSNNHRYHLEDLISRNDKTCLNKNKDKNKAISCRHHYFK